MGLVKRHPFAFCCKVAARCWLFVVWSLRGVVGGGFPLTPPIPLAGM